MKQAIKLNKLDGFTGIAYLYKVEPAIEGFDFVISSATTAAGAETYLFGADEWGQVLSWSELDGSQKNTLDNDQPFHNIGYEVIRGN